MAEVSVARESGVMGLRARNAIGGRRDTSLGRAALPAQNRVRIPSDITKIPDREYNGITRTLEKRNANAPDASRYLERENMTNRELGNFYAVASYFQTSYRISASARTNSRRWANLALQEIRNRRR